MLDYEVFLSHSNADQSAVEALARQLRDVGLEPFLGAWHLTPGRPWQDERAEALERSRTYAIFIGADGLVGWQKSEMRVALDRQSREPGFRVIPVLLSSAPRPVRLPLFLEQLTWVDFAAGPDAFHRLVRGIQGLPAGPSAPAPTNLYTGHAEVAIRSEPEPILPYLCDRGSQAAQLDFAVPEHRRKHPKRPLVLLVHGHFKEAHDKFVERLHTSLLPPLLPSLLDG